MGSGRRRSRLGTLTALLGSALTFRLGTVEIAEHSMRPTLHDGDWVVIRRRPGSIRVGDVVILDHPDRPGFELVKRVASVITDGLMVLGDDQGAGSIDSATFGGVPIGSVTGRVLLRYRPLPPRIIR
jgi:nickel-type superoxide dismutase maturation protease